MSSQGVAAKSYAERAALPTVANAVARDLLLLMERKQTNLSVAVDLVHKEQVLALADSVGPHICLLKTHVDIIVDFDWDFVERLSKLAEKHQFLIFEDRKFADIGNTVIHQYRDGIFRIASWSHITNAHPLPGDGIVTGLRSVGLGNAAHPDRGLLLLAEMSSMGSLARGSYTDESVAMANRHRDFVIGFIAGRRLVQEDAQDPFIYMTPGVGFESTPAGKPISETPTAASSSSSSNAVAQTTATSAKTTDGKGQTYTDPRSVILGRGSDIIIVGRGIYEAKDPAQEALRYKQAGWQAYLERIGKQAHP